MSVSSKIRAPAPGPCPCRRPSVVTEGYRRCPPCRRPTSGQFCPTFIVVIYNVFCVCCSKNMVFYRVSWPSMSSDFILATLKNYGFSVVFGHRRGSGTENLTSWRSWRQHRANVRQEVGYMGQHKAKIGANLGKQRATIGQDVGQMGPHRAKIGPTWGHMGPHKARLGPTWAMIGANLRHQRANIGQDVGQVGPHKAKIGPTSGHMGPHKAKIGPTWAMIGPTSAKMRVTWVPPQPRAKTGANLRPNTTTTTTTKKTRTTTTTTPTTTTSGQDRGKPAPK